MSNRETRVRKDYLHVFLAFRRTGTNKDNRCIRQVARNEDEDLKILRHKLRALGGTWRIHRTVNARCPIKAMKELMKQLIDHPERASTIDQQWRTALLQPNCIYGDKKFMFDIDTKNTREIDFVLMQYDVGSITKIESPKGWHYITKPFDTREVCALPDVTLIRDGYYFVEEVSDDNQ